MATASSACSARGPEGGEPGRRALPSPALRDLHEEEHHGGSRQRLQHPRRAARWLPALHPKPSSDGLDGGGPPLRRRRFHREQPRPAGAAEAPRRHRPWRGGRGRGLQGGPSLPVAPRLCTAHGTVREARGRFRLHQPALRHLHFHGSPHAQRAAVLRAVREGTHRGEDARQDPGRAPPRQVDGGAARPRLCRRPPQAPPPGDRRRGQGRPGRLRAVPSDTLLRNPLYVGKVRGQGGALHQGEHGAILEEATFAAAAVSLDARTTGRTRQRRSDEYALARILRCAPCDAPMAPCSVKGRNGRRYRYYRCRGHQQHAERCPTGLVAADALETAVAAQVIKGNGLEAPTANEASVSNAAAAPPSKMAILPALNGLHAAWTMLAAPERCRLLRSLVREVRVERGQLRIALQDLPANNGRAAEPTARRV